ncbi:hypothetical protein B0H10DRAFT_1993415 [Mycena sp. CBHHK59/15]|nr:hypothetical protein B0H10DRAFT_1993415 [Mycena sp. CBHHK59/15]
MKLASHLASLGDAKTFPFAPTQSQRTPDERKSTGVTEDMIRYSVGIESADDIIGDLDGAADCARVAEAWLALFLFLCALRRECLERVACNSLCRCLPRH